MHFLSLKYCKIFNTCILNLCLDLGCLKHETMVGLAISDCKPWIRCYRSDINWERASWPRDKTMTTKPYNNVMIKRAIWRKIRIFYLEQLFVICNSNIFWLSKTSVWVWIYRIRIRNNENITHYFLEEDLLVRLPLQPTTPHWETPSMAVRAIFLPVCHRRTAQGLPNWIQTMFGRAVFIQLLS
jgi:hypothetical protein